MSVPRHLLLLLLLSSLLSSFGSSSPPSHSPSPSPSLPPDPHSARFIIGICICGGLIIVVWTNRPAKRPSNKHLPALTIAFAGVERSGLEVIKSVWHEAATKAGFDLTWTRSPSLASIRVLVIKLEGRWLNSSVAIRRKIQQEVEALSPAGTTITFLMRTQAGRFTIDEKEQLKSFASESTDRNLHFIGIVHNNSKIECPSEAKVVSELSGFLQRSHIPNRTLKKI